MPAWQMLTLGLITVVFGIAVLVWPAATLRLLGLLAGIWLIATGLLQIVRAFRREHGAHGMSDKLLSGALGIVLVLGGAACIRNLATGALALAVVLGVAWMLSGLAEILFGLFAKGSTRAWLLVLGAASVAVGVLFVVWPDISPRTVVLLTGITALILGTGEVSFALQQRHRPTQSGLGSA
ncbi:DUF308 domain-containing protein [Dactylosporangium sp. AC04546]|uniref:HdeD family acid-resistance protein n=1 Tax=Dactylosporangium sp. AC04546 TaxID=2862460 RepID=UPI001EE0F1CA|nr:DUF308 domain-containing protein [Dactylosporangium sp. AC04546]WVK79245.1 DUF308 domain-containing protein [Dactylosporangium sp. AC04546]